MCLGGHGRPRQHELHGQGFDLSVLRRALALIVASVSKTHRMMDSIVEESKKAVDVPSPSHCSCSIGRDEKGFGVDMYFSVFTYSTKSFAFCTDESFGPTAGKYVQLVYIIFKKRIKEIYRVVPTIINHHNIFIQGSV